MSGQPSEPPHNATRIIKPSAARAGGTQSPPRSLTSLRKPLSDSGDTRLSWSTLIATGRFIHVPR